MRKYLILTLFSISHWLYAQQTTRFMVVGDPHIYSPAADFKATILYELVLAAIEENVDFIFFTGDLMVRGFTDEAQKDSVLKDWRFVLDTLNIHNIRVFACRGNNDVGSKESWDSLFCGEYSLPLNGPEGEKNITYALTVNNVLFISLDQYSESRPVNQAWLDEILVTNEKPHIFVAGHEPAFKLLHSNCMGAYPEQRNNFWESLISARTKIFFCGHDHFYDHTIIDDGDVNPDNDVHQVIVGTGSHLHSDSEYDGDNGRWTPVRLFHEELNGYVFIQVIDNLVKLTWKHRIEAHAFEDGGDSFDFVSALTEKVNFLSDYALFQNYPNPFNPSSKIRYSLPKSETVNIEVFNILGQTIETLLNKAMPAGSHQLTFNAENISSGVYFYRMQAGDYQDVKKMILLK